MMQTRKKRMELRSISKAWQVKLLRMGPVRELRQNMQIDTYTRLLRLG